MNISRRVLLARMGVGSVAIAGGIVVVRASSIARVPEARAAEQTEEGSPMAQTEAEALAGSWTYRSLLNSPTPNVPFNSLRFGEGELVIDVFDPGSFSGRLVFGPTTELRLSGSSSIGNPFVMRFQGVGASPDTSEWVYDYVGYLVPEWPNGVDQRPAILGSIVRTAPHDGNPAGVVASWIAVRRD